MIYQKKWLVLLLIIGLACLVLKILLDSKFGHSAFVYVGVPFLVAVALLAFVKSGSETSDVPNENLVESSESPEEPLEDSESDAGFLFKFVFWSLVVMLSTSVFLGEGFICVLMFMPIYFGIVFLIALIVVLIRKAEKKGKDKRYVHIIPALIVVSSFEGVVPEFEFNRDYSVTRDILVSASPEQIHSHLMSPMALDVDRHWLLEIFPMPTNIDAETLSAGDIHTIDFVYHRWFVTNTHEGSMQLEISEMDDNYIRTSFLENSSYIKNYLELEGTEIHFEAIDDQSTKVSLTIHYQRFLDPVWYFGPLQSYAIGEVADLLLEELFVPTQR